MVLLNDAFQKQANFVGKEEHAGYQNFLSFSCNSFKRSLAKGR